jgi:hypothetical protein
MTRRKLMLTIAASSLAVTAVVVVPTAVGALSKSSKASTTTSVAATGNTGNNGKKDCQYPPKRTPELTLNASPNSVKKNSQINFNGKLTVNKCKVPGRTIGLYSSPTAVGPWTLIGTTTTQPSGEYHFKATIGTTTTYYRTVFAGDATFDPATSNVEKVTVK